MPLHDFYCHECHTVFEEIHKDGEVILCECSAPAFIIPICKLADYTGQASRTVQYVTRKSPIQDSHIQKLTSDTSFLRNSIPTVSTEGS